MRLTAAEQVRLVDQVDAAAAAAAPGVVIVALLRGLLASHGPYWHERQCVTKFERRGVPGCYLCGDHGEPVAVQSRPAMPGTVWHVHADPDPACAGCPDTRFPCRVFVAVADVVCPGWLAPTSN